jgi:hypothetical protein
MINEISPKRAGNSGVEAVTAQTPQSKAQTESAKFTQAQSVTKKDETFFSPVVKIDTQTHAAILVFRDTKTGEVEREFPNKQQVAAYEAPQKAATQNVATPPLSDPVEPTEKPTEKPIEKPIEKTPIENSEP